MLKSNKSVINFPHSVTIYSLTFQQLIDLNEKIEIPDVQVDLNEDKVCQMIESYNKNPKFFGPKCLLTLATMNINDITKYYLVDGQHRYEAIKRLLNKDKSLTNIVLLTVVPVESRVELIKLFKELNIDSLKCPKLNNFEWFLIEKLKEKIKEKFPTLPNNISKRHNLYTASEFLEILQRRNILTSFSVKYKLDKLNDEDIVNKESSELIDKDNYYINTIMFILEKKNKEFFAKAKYLELIKADADEYRFHLGEKAMIENHICMFFKRNNFFDWLIDSKIEPEHLKVSPRITISDSTKNKVWINEFEAKNSGMCPIWNCKKILDKDVQNSWQCGHIIRINNGGKTTLDNLRPICPTCNNKMSDTNWYDYEIYIKKNYIIETYFDDEEEIKCKKKGCNNKITKDTFKFVISKEKVRPLCEECKTN